MPARRRQAGPTADSTPARGGTITAAHAERVGERARVQRSGAAERDQREVARVDAALDRHGAHRLLHRRVDHRDDTRRVDAGRCERVAGRGADVEPPEPGKRRPVGDAPEHQVGVGDRRLGAAAPVARGPGLAPALCGTDDERAARVEARDRAAAGADRVDVERRQPDREAARPSRCAAGSGTPPRTRHTSVLVPPMSNVDRVGKPHAAATAAAAAHAAGGPDSSRRGRDAAASRDRTSPPADVITSTSSASGERAR